MNHSMDDVSFDGYGAGARAAQRRSHARFRQGAAALAVLGCLLAACSGGGSGNGPAEDGSEDPAAVEDAAVEDVPVTEDAGVDMDAGDPFDAGPDGEQDPDAAGDAEDLADGGPEWVWEQFWPGLVFEGTAEVPEGRFDLPIPGGATVRQLEMTYTVDIGEVVDGNRHQFSFTCADETHPYRGGLFGFLFLQGELGHYVFRNGLPGEGATDPTRLPFTGSPSTHLDIRLRWDAVAGTAVIEVTDPDGATAGVTSTEKVAPTDVPRAITVIFGYDTITMPNPAESASIGWRYQDLMVRAAP